MTTNDELAGRDGISDAIRRGYLLPSDLELIGAPMPPVAPPHPACIPWVPIADMPESVRAATEVLLWAEGWARVASWSYARRRWEDGENVVRAATHFAEINPPEGV